MSGSSSLRSNLSASLRAHVPADALEAEHRARMLALVDGAPRGDGLPRADRPDPCSRAHFEPGHFTASAFVLSPDSASLLLILHGKLGLWLQPGGHIDPSDVDVHAAARREVAEETGLTELDAVAGLSLLDLDVHSLPPNPKRGEPAHEHFDVRIALRARTWTAMAGSDALSTRWVPLDEVAEIGTDESVRRAARTLRRSLVATGAI